MFSMPLLLSQLSCGPAETEFARAVVIGDLTETIGGPKALARPGDILMENEHLRIAITATTRQRGDEELHPPARTSMGPSLYGGSLVDADLQWPDPTTERGHGRDQLAEIFPTVNMNVTQPDTEAGIQIVEDGSSGRAVVRVESDGVPFLTMLEGLWALVGQPASHIRHDYVVEAGVPWVTMTTTVVFGWDGAGELPAAEPTGYHEEPFPIIDWAVETGVVLGDFYLSGGSIDVFAPGIGFDEDGAVFDRMSAGENTFLDPFQFPFVAGVGDGVSYAIAPVEGDLFVPLFTASQTAVMGGARDGDGTDGRFPDGTTLDYSRMFFVGHGDVASVVDQYLEAREIPYGTVSGHVIEAYTAEPLSGVDVFASRKGDDGPWSQFRTDVHPDDRNPDGSFEGRLPVGVWELVVHEHGRPDPDPLTVTVEEGAEAIALLVAPRTGALTFDIVDETGRWVPAKLSIFRLDGPTNRDELKGDARIGGDPEFVLFPLRGSGAVELPPGTYQAIASRGLEYEIDVSEPFDISAQKGHHLELQVVRSIDTEGWVSADLHVHSSPSHDAGITLPDRIATMVCEGVEFFAATDHDYLTDFAPTVELLGMEEWVQTAVGNEITTIELGHFLGFPLQGDFLGDAGGAVDWTGLTPDEILASFAEDGKNAGYEPVTFVGHARDGILGYFDQYGWSPYTGQVQTPALSLINPLLAADNLSWDFDGIEVMNGKRMELVRTPTQDELDRFAVDPDSVDAYDLLSRTAAEQADLEADVYRLGYGQEGQLDDWFTLLNQGFKLTALGNSDTHGATSTEAGCPRNYVASSADDPAWIDDQEIADAVRNHQVVASYGPFVRMWVDGVGIGGEVVPEDGTVEIEVEVQAPSWVPVDRIELYENGTMVEEKVVARGDGPLHLVETFERTLEADSWYVVTVMGDGDLAPVFTPVEVPYIELQLVIAEALGGVEAVSALLSPAIPIPRQYPVVPYAVTNPVWVDLDGDGFDPPGIPSWLRVPVAPE